MRDDKTMTNSSTKENVLVIENGKKRGKEERPATKVVVRRLPPSMTEEQFKMQVSPLPDIDYFYFVSADMSLSPNAFCRAYLNFIDQSDLFIFTQKFDGYVFLDSKGGEFPAVVEFAPFQRIPKNRPNRKKDLKVGTIEGDPVFIAFKEQLEAESLENKVAANASKQHFFETSLLPEKKELISTPLLEYIRNKRAERQRIRDEKREEKKKKDLERRKVKEEQKRVKKDEDPSVVKRSEIQPLSNPNISKPNPQKSTDSQNVILDKSHKGQNLKNSESGVDFENDAKNYFTGFKRGGQEVIKHVYDKLCSFSTAGMDNGLSSDEKNNFNMCLKNCARHSEIEKEILKTVKPINNTYNSKIQTKISDNSSLVKTSQTHIISQPTSCFGSHSIEHVSRYESKDNILMPGLPKPIINNMHNNVNFNKDSLSKASSESEISSYKEYKANIQKSLEHESNTVPTSSCTENEIFKETKRKCSTTKDISGEALRKSLQKVVSDVLGKSTVKSPRKNNIHKPKTFVKRVVDGSGEQYTRPGFNSPNFYLPPRAFGCGPSQCMADNSSLDSAARSHRPLTTTPMERGHFSTFSKKLPSFWSKPIVISKSDSDIEASGSNRKFGGSQENLKKKKDILDTGIKPFARRPYIIRKNTLYFDRNVFM